ncbi:MAG: pyridine nucleotide-disulfide oxidoreductase [Promethearchaeota archaeon]|nr:MAG: pyridine nucleotide-disulfide oxidoreductase [Candidatus Lokiarchaeota archaeon]
MEKISFIVSDKSFEKFMMMTILGTTGSAMDTEMNFFFTFWGLELLKKGKKPKVQGMPFPMKGMAAKMFRKKLKDFGWDDPVEMIKDAVEEGNMKLYPCQMTMDLMGIKREELFDFVEDPVGAASFLELSEGGRVVSL